VGKDAERFVWVRGQIDLLVGEYRYHKGHEEGTKGTMFFVVKI
jgi:hypothetical protein